MINGNFGRTIAAMITPFNSDGSVNYAVAEELAVHLVDNGNDALVLCGTTGESPSLSWDEKYQLFKVVKEVVAGKALTIAGTGANSTKTAITATIRAAELGLDGSLQVVPYYNKPPQSGLYSHFQAIANAVPAMPIMLYNIPSRTGKNLEPETIAELAKIDNIVAIKEASGSLEQVCEIRRLTPASFTIYSGDDFLTLPLLTLGGTGVVSVASHLVGKQIQEMIQAFTLGKINIAREIQLKLFPLFKVLFCTTNPIPIKAALKLQGWNVGGLRLPLETLNPDLEEKLATVLKEFDLL